MAQQPEWREAAFDVYRAAWTELLENWKGPQKLPIEFYVEELKEALLDLKQATLANEPAQAFQSMAEILVLLSELRLAGE